MDLSLSLFECFDLAGAKQAENFVSLFEDQPMHGLTLTTEQAQFILESAKHSAAENGRLLTEPTLPELVTLKFSASAYVNNFNFHRIVAAVVENVLHIQDATGDAFTDRQIINHLLTFFESKACNGSESLLSDFAEQIIKRFNSGHKHPFSRLNLDFSVNDYLNGEYYSFDEEDDQ